MLLNRAEISADKSFNLLTDSILERDQAKTTDIFFRMVQSGQSIGDALSIVAAAEAPFVNVPCHINIKDTFAERVKEAKIQHFIDEEWIRKAFLKCRDRARPRPPRLHRPHDTVGAGVHDRPADGRAGGRPATLER